VTHCPTCTCGRGSNAGPDLSTATLIYPQVDKIFATKHEEAPADLRGPYVHEFSADPAPPRMYGLDNGDLLITTRTGGD
jgi:hypothetical protein